MNVRELKEELKNFDDNAPVLRVYGTMYLSIPDQKCEKRHMTHKLIGVVDNDARGRCLFIFEEL